MTSKSTRKSGCELISHFIFQFGMPRQTSMLCIYEFFILFALHSTHNIVRNSHTLAIIWNSHNQIYELDEEWLKFSSHSEEIKWKNWKNFLRLLNFPVPFVFFNSQLLCSHHSLFLLFHFIGNNFFAVVHNDVVYSCRNIIELLPHSTNFFFLLNLQLRLHFFVCGSIASIVEFQQ